MAEKICFANLSEKPIRGAQTAAEVADCTCVYYCVKPIWHWGHILSNPGITTHTAVCEEINVYIILM